ncbi:hypothetical protein H9P43_006194 [Blastocladiella emersonii ATCC 22665]|nr:hypothetical protein H9P43_006194 [Blastocladiella emersonii ATCC 22665]
MANDFFTLSRPADADDTAAGSPRKLHGPWRVLSLYAFLLESLAYIALGAYAAAKWPAFLAGPKGVAPGASPPESSAVYRGLFIAFCFTHALLALAGVLGAAGRSPASCRFMDVSWLSASGKVEGRAANKSYLGVLVVLAGCAAAFLAKAPVPGNPFMAGLLGVSVLVIIIALIPLVTEVGSVPPNMHARGESGEALA